MPLRGIWKNLDTWEEMSEVVIVNKESFQKANSNKERAKTVKFRFKDVTGVKLEEAQKVLHNAVKSVFLDGRTLPSWLARGILERMSVLTGAVLVFNNKYFEDFPRIYLRTPLSGSLVRLSLWRFAPSLKDCLMLCQALKHQTSLETLALAKLKKHRCGNGLIFLTKYLASFVHLWCYFQSFNERELFSLARHMNEQRKTIDFSFCAEKRNETEFVVAGKAAMAALLNTPGYMYFCNNLFLEDKAMKNLGYASYLKALWGKKVNLVNFNEENEGFHMN